MNNQYLSAAEASVLNNLMPGNQNLQLGSKLQTALSNGVAIGKKFYLDPVNGNDDFDGLGYETAFKTLEKAYAALTANKNEILYIIGGASALNLAAAFTWAKSYTHLIGVCGDMKFGGRVRIGHSANFTSLFTINASGCIFKNIHWQMGRGSTTNVNCVVLSATAHYNYFEGCHFDAPLNATEGGGTQAWRSLVLTSGVRSTTVNNCTFGEWTVVCASANGVHVEFGGLNAGTHFVGCTFLTCTSSTSMVTVKSNVDLGGAYAYVTFEGCKFISLATGPDAVFSVPSAGLVVVDNCTSFGFTAWSAASSNKLLVSSPTGVKTGGQGQSPT
jgi:hypothetical protein